MKQDAVSISSKSGKERANNNNLDMANTSKTLSWSENLNILHIQIIYM